MQLRNKTVYRKLKLLHNLCLNLARMLDTKEKYSSGKTVGKTYTKCGHKNEKKEYEFHQNSSKSIISTRSLTQVLSYNFCEKCLICWAINLAVYPLKAFYHLWQELGSICRQSCTINHPRKLCWPFSVLCFSIRNDNLMQPSLKDQFIKLLLRTDGINLYDTPCFHLEYPPTQRIIAPQTI